MLNILWKAQGPVKEVLITLYSVVIKQVEETLPQRQMPQRSDFDVKTWTVTH